MTTKSAVILEGKTLAAGIRENIKKEIEGFAAKGLEKPRLVALEVSGDGGSKWYLDQQQKLAADLGIEYERVHPVPGQMQLEERIKWFNQDASCHGIFVTMPLPEGFSADTPLLMLDGRKDVEGVTPASLGLMVLRKAKLIPPTAYAAFRLIESTGIKLRGKKATVVGQSAIVGRPLQMLLGENRVTTVVCNTGTSEETMAKAIADSDIVVGCAGSPGMIKGAWIRPGAVVIDVGTTEVNGKLAGDVEFEAAKERAGFITPVPGGVGPLTVTMLMQNLVTAYKWQKGIN